MRQGGPWKCTYSLIGFCLDLISQGNSHLSLINLRRNGWLAVFQEPGPVAVVFRGSDVTMKSRGSLLDICFDASLVGGDEKSTPPFCGNFTAKDIDYIQQAESV